MTGQRGADQIRQQFGGKGGLGKQGSVSAREQARAAAKRAVTQDNVSAREQARAVAKRAVTQGSVSALRTSGVISYTNAAMEEFANALRNEKK